MTLTDGFADKEGYLQTFTGWRGSNALLVAAATLAVIALPCQSQAQEQNPAFTSQTSIVLVPALVRTDAGALVFTLKADDFVLTDDGVPQKLTLDEETGGEPLALVVVVEVGGAGARQFQKYGSIAPPLAPMLASIVGNVAHQVAVVTFDSQPRLLQEFTGDVDEAADALRTLTPGCTRQHHYDDCTGPHAVHDVPLGDNGAAILDSLAYAVDLLRNQPIGYRRAILLISETIDRGSHTTIAQAVRDLADTNTTIYSIAFSTSKSEAAHYAARQLPTGSNERPTGMMSFENPHPNPPHGCMGKDPNPDPDATRNRWAQAYDCLAQLVPPLTFAKMAAIATVDSLQRNVPEAVSQISGGEYFKLTDLRSLEGSLATISNHLPNRYVLSFHPHSPHEGLHTLSLRLPNYEGLQITARNSYWADGDTTAPAK